MPREGEPAAQRCLVRPSLPAGAHCVQPCQMSGSSRALVEGRDLGRERGGWTLCLGCNEVCINEGRQEIECLNWTLASPTAPRPPATFLFSILCILEAISRAGPGENGLRALAMWAVRGRGGHGSRHSQDLSCHSPPGRSWVREPRGAARLCLMNAALPPSHGPPRGPRSHSVSLICIKYPFLAGFPPPLLPPSRLFCE